MNTHRRRPPLTLLDETAQTMSEYSLLIGLIAIVVASAVPGLGSAIRGLYVGLVAAFGS